MTEWPTGSARPPFDLPPRDGQRIAAAIEANTAAVQGLAAAFAAVAAAMTTQSPSPNGKKEDPIESGAEGGDGLTGPPDQPVVTDALGVLRFRPNAIVCDLLALAERNGLADMNAIAAGEYAQQDRIQFAQLLGYSVDGLADLPYAATSLALAATRGK